MEFLSRKPPLLHVTYTTVLCDVIVFLQLGIKFSTPFSVWLHMSQMEGGVVVCRAACAVCVCVCVQDKVVMFHTEVCPRFLSDG